MVNYGFITGVCALALLLLGYTAQMYKIYKEKSGHGLSYCSFLLMFSMNLLMFLYFVSILDVIGMLESGIPMLFLISTICMKRYYEIKDRNVLPVNSTIGGDL